MTPLSCSAPPTCSGSPTSSNGSPTTAPTSVSASPSSSRAKATSNRSKWNENLCSPVHKLQRARLDVDNQAMHGNRRQVGAAANHVDNLAHVDMHVIEGAKPAHEAVEVAPSLLLNQLLRVNPQRLHGGAQVGGVNVREAAFGVADHQHFAHAQQVDAARERANQIVGRPRAFGFSDGRPGSTQFQHIAALQPQRLLKHLHQSAIHARYNGSMFARRVANNGQLLLPQELLVIRQNFVKHHRNTLLSSRLVSDNEPGLV